MAHKDHELAENDEIMTPFFGVTIGTCAGAALWLLAIVVSIAAGCHPT